MTTQAFDPATELKRLLEAGAISEEALQAITGIQHERLRAFLDEHAGAPGGLTARPQVLSGNEIGRLSVLAGQLTEGMHVGDDERLVAIYESLTIDCRLTARNIADLAGLDAGDVDGVLRDPGSLQAEKKYRLALAGGHLINAVNLARRER
ncbi:HTH domain-containing protein [Leifsonia aquatica]|uniref:HTH domain-containing protein n=1 Tax=Leifsonia aquatica TaxID=144185 RepID=UPI0038053521